jgi:histidinol-phosphatase
VDRDLLEHAVELVEEAGGVAARRFAEAAPSAGASGTTPVEVEVEELLRRRIGARYPDDAVLGHADRPTAGTAGRRWVIDPVNGTGLFAQRVPTFDVLLAVEDAEGPAVAVAGYPMSDEVLYAGRGLGCWHAVAGRPVRRVRVNDNDRLRGAVVEMLNPLAWSEELLLALHREVYLQPWTKGDVDLATGLADALVIAGQPVGYEFLAVLPLLVGEAGGRVTDLSGRDVLTGDGTVLASNGRLHDALLELVAGLPHGRDFAALRRPT